MHPVSLLLLIIHAFSFNSTFSFSLKTFKSWNFSESSLRQLPIDKVKHNYVRIVQNAIFSEIPPTPLKQEIKVVGISRDALENCLDLDYDDVAHSKTFRYFASGNMILNATLSHRYGGHQFGSWASQLGDGRAHLLGEYNSDCGERWELQLKGSGRTPYSRHGDGRAVLRSSIREFLCSEAMYHLGVPTSRAVALVTSGDPVIRDPFYNGNIVKENAAVVLRLAPSWFRFGSFEILTKNNEFELLAHLLDFTIDHHFASSIAPNDPNKYFNLFATVRDQTIFMVAKWMSLGFAHGVCNTDNFSIISITIDYGPFGFVDSYDPQFVPNLSDDTGMYALDRQPSVALFNLNKLFQAFQPVLTEIQVIKIKKLLASFEEDYQTMLMKEFRKKLGLIDEQEEDSMLVGSLLHLMKDVKADFTMTFRHLSCLTLDQMKSSNIPHALWSLRDLKTHKYFNSWLQAYHDRIKQGLGQADEVRLQRMRSINPRYVLRTWMAESAIRKAEKGDFSEVWRLHMTLKHPFEEQVSAEASGYSNRPPDWSKDLRVSCSS